MEIKMSERMEEARASVDAICKEKGLDLRDCADWQSILREIDSRFDKRTYKCKRCFDSGIISWIGPDGMMYGRKCGLCRYWDDQRERAKNRG